MSKFADKLKKLQSFRLSELDKEIMRACLENPRRGLSIWMMGYFDGIALPYQDYFESAPQHDKMLIAGIRTGKSELVAMAALKFCQFHSGSRFLNTSISSEQAKIVYQTCLKYCYMPRFQHWVEQIQSSPYPTIKLANGSELWFRSIGYEAELIRGFEFDFINVDEAAYVIRERAITTLQGRLLGINPYTKAARAGLFWQVSSPKGRGWVFDRWKKGDPAYLKEYHPGRYLSLRATTYDNILLDRAELERTIEDMPLALQQQEIMGEFLQDNDVLFPYEYVMAACNEFESVEVKVLYDRIEKQWNARQNLQRPRIMTSTAIDFPAGHLERITEDIEHYEVDPEPGHTYVAGWDLGKKANTKGRNACVGLLLDTTHEPWTMAAYWYSEQMGYLDAKANMEAWQEKYSSNGGKCITIFDATGKGDVVLELIQREGSIRDIEGIEFTGANKPYLLQAARIVIEKRLVRMPFIKRLVKQFTEYTPDDKDIAQDIVMAFALAAYRARDLMRIAHNKKRQVVLSATPGQSPTAYAGGYRAPASRHNPRYIADRLARRATRTAIYGPNRKRAG